MRNICPSGLFFLTFIVRSRTLLVYFCILPKFSCNDWFVYGPQVLKNAAFSAQFVNVPSETEQHYVARTYRLRRYPNPQSFSAWLYIPTKLFHPVEATLLVLLNPRVRRIAKTHRAVASGQIMRRYFTCRPIHNKRTR